MTTETEVSFVNRSVNNIPYEHGRNCATLGFDQVEANRILDVYGYCTSTEYSDYFWTGFNEGPREDRTVISLPRQEENK